MNPDIRSILDTVSEFTEPQRMSLEEAEEFISELIDELDMTREALREDIANQES